MKPIFAALLILGVMMVPATAQEKSKSAATKPAAEKSADKKAKKPDAYAESVPPRTVSGIRYGENPRHVIDFWKADSKTPTPLVFVIHGG